jgi:hypothetical protein
MVTFLVVYLAISCELTLIFLLVSLFIEKMQDQKLLALYCLLMFFLWPFIFIKLIVDVIKTKIASIKINKMYEH